MKTAQNKVICSQCYTTIDEDEYMETIIDVYGNDKPLCHDCYQEYRRSLAEEGII